MFGWSKFLVVGVLLWITLFSVKVFAKGYEGIPLDHRNPMTPNSLIRVKVFPHKVNYPPHGKDVVTNTVSLRAAKACRQYRGSQSKAWRVGKALRRLSRFTFNTATLSEPVYLRCGGTVVVDWVYT